PRGPEFHAAHPKRPAVANQHEFDAAAADINQQMRAAIEAERVPRSLINQPRFIQSRNDLDRDSSFVLDSTDELVAIARLAHSAGRYCPHPIDAAYARQPLERS